jgi:hypothetical protein
MWRLLENGHGELMKFNDVREELQEKNFNLGRWLQGVFDGELTPFKLRPMLECSVGSIRLTQFAFHRGQIQQFFTHRGIEQSSKPTSTKEKERAITVGDDRSFAEEMGQSSTLTEASRNWPLL